MIGHAEWSFFLFSSVTLQHSHTGHDRALRQVTNKPAFRVGVHNNYYYPMLDAIEGGEGKWLSTFETD